MKTYKIIIIMVMIFLPILMNAQENGATIDTTEMSVFRQEASEQVYFERISKQIRTECTQITEEQINKVATAISKRIAANKADFPSDICCDENTVFTHNWSSSYGEYGDYDNYGEYVYSDRYEAYNINTGEFSNNWGKNHYNAQICKQKAKPATSKSSETSPTEPPQEVPENVVNLTKQIKADDIIYDDTYLYALNINDTYDDDYGMYYYSEWKITQYLLSTGKVVAGTDYKEGNGRFKTFKELEAQKDFRPVKECKLAQKVFQLMKQQRVDNIVKRIKASDIIYDDTYLYALNINNTYDDDYGMYYYSEWKITQYLLSTGKVIAGTGYIEGDGRFKTFKELEAQKDFRPVKECELAQEVFRIMKQQGK